MTFAFAFTQFVTFPINSICFEIKSFHTSRALNILINLPYIVASFGTKQELLRSSNLVNNEHLDRTFVIIVDHCLNIHM